MNASLRKQIHESMDLRDNDELLQIWQTNDRVEWSDEAFEVIREVLQSRGILIPVQDEPILEHEEKEDDTADLAEWELRIVDDENPPDFYDPFQVIRFSRWLNVAALVSIGISIAAGLAELPRSRSIMLSYTYGVANGAMIALALAFLLVAIGAALQVAMMYFPLKALAYILPILMQMEYNSRKPVSAQTTTES